MAKLLLVIRGIPCEVSPANEFVKRDLKAKKEKLGHFQDNV
jgi:hypothetical protein